MSTIDSFTSDGLYYNRINGVMSIGGTDVTQNGNAYVDASSRKEKLVLKSFVNGQRIKAIADNAFRAYQNTGFIEYLDIQEGFESIGENAFRDCCILKTVFIPSSMRSIGKSAFLFWNLSSKSAGKGTCNIIFRGHSMLTTLYSLSFSYSYCINIFICINRDIQKISSDNGTPFSDVTELNLYSSHKISFLGKETTLANKVFYCFNENTMCKNVEKKLHIYIYILTMVM